MNTKCFVFAAAILAVAGPVWADTAFTEFATVCADTRADLAAVGAAADAKGWRNTQQMGATVMPGVTVDGKLSKGAKLGDAPLALSAWRGATKSGVQVSDCTVRVDRTDFPQEVARAQAWAGFAAQEAASQKRIFRFTDVSGVRHSLARGEYDAAAAGPGLEILTISSDNQGTTLDLLRIKK